MRFKPSYVVVAVIVAAVFAYLLVRPLLGHGDKAAQAAAKALAASAAALPLVQVSLTPEARHTYAVTFRGRTQAARTVVVRSETAGVVAAAPILQGTFVRAGTVLCRLAVDARAAALDQMRANMRAKQLQMQASANLAAKGFRSKTQVLTDQAGLDAASAAVRQAEVALRQVNIVAPVRRRVRPSRRRGRGLSGPGPVVRDDDRARSPAGGRRRPRNRGRQDQGRAPAPRPSWCRETSSAGGCASWPMMPTPPPAPTGSK